MIEVQFYNEIEDCLIKYATIAARYQDKWVLCKHKERNTYEIPGGHREPGEIIEDAAKRELYEETGAIDYILSPVSVYTVIDSELDMPNETYGMLYFAEVKEFGVLPDFEMEKIVLFDQLPGNLTYPFIMPHLYKKVMEYLSEN